MPPRKQLPIIQPSLQRLHHYRRKHNRKELHRTNRRHIQTATHATQALLPAQKIRQQHRTLKAHLEAERRQERLHHQMVHHHLGKRLQQQIEKVQPLLSRKTPHHKI